MEENNKISDWLEKLQQESWNLELLISGFSIFLLIQVGDVIDDFSDEFGNHYNLPNNIRGVVYAFAGIGKLGAIVLTINLIVHILLRGFWIGAIGLRSVQSKLDISKLNYSEFFQEKLRKKITPLDDLLTRIDNISSVIFSFSFLIVFMLLSLFLSFSFIGILAFLNNVLIDPIENETLNSVLTTTTIILIFTIMAMGVIYMIDTLSLGFFKRFRWLSKLYYPIYQFFGWITLARIYRAIYYSIITRFPKSQIRLFLIVYLGILMLSPFHKFDQYIFYPDNWNLEQENFSYFYDDLRTDRWIRYATIPSQVITEDYMPIFVRYEVDQNEDIKKGCPDFSPSKKEKIYSGISFGGGINFTNPSVDEKEPGKLLDCLADHYNIYLNDSLCQELEYWFYKHPNKGEIGLLTTLDLSTSSKGKNILKITRNIYEEEEGGTETLKEEHYVSIPFWLSKR